MRRQDILQKWMSMPAVVDRGVLGSHACAFRRSTRERLSSCRLLLLLMLSRMLASCRCLFALLASRGSICALACLACACEQGTHNQDMPTRAAGGQDRCGALEAPQ